MNEDWKAKLGAAFNMEVPCEEELKAALLPEEHPRAHALALQGKEMLKVVLDKKGRKGKQATIVTGFKCDDDALKQLAAVLKKQCGVGGSARGGEILIQGDFRQKVLDILQKQGFRAKVI